MRGGFRKWQGQYLATCARLDEAMRAMETAIREKWWGEYQAWDARSREQQRQPASYSLIAVQRATAIAKWLVGLSGAGTVLAFGFYVQSYLSILSIKNDCVSLRFVADANVGAAYLARRYLVSGGLALLAIALPTAIGIGRNVLRWWKALKWPPLQPGHEFDGWPEFQVAARVTFWQVALVVYSAYLFFTMTLSLPFSTIGSTPERVLGVWHHFEVPCSLPQPPDDQGVS